MTNVVIGLGSNLGDRIAMLREAVRRISRIAPVLARSRVLETAPVGGPPGQPAFLNAAVLVAWSPPSDLFALLDALMEIERDLGRVRDVPNGPRTIDLDILWADQSIVDAPRLIVPHPRLTERPFALVPTLDVVPDAIDPRTGSRYVVTSQENVGVRVTKETL